MMTATLTPSAILPLLKTETRTCHEQVERSIGSFLRMEHAQSYRTLLEVFWGFVSPLEEAIAAVPELARAIPDLGHRLRTGLLRRDLLEEGHSAASVERLPRLGELPRMFTPAQALGCLYVLEGSTLGGPSIVRRVNEQGVSIAHACRFFLSHGENLGTMWKRFSAAAEAYAALHPDQLEEICAAARETFQAIGDWVAICYLSDRTALVK